MKLPIEWDKRLQIWLDTLRRDLYHPVVDIQFEGFVTKEQLGYERAMAEGDFKPMPTGTPWGYQWEYAWMRANVTVPEKAAGEKLVLCLNMGNPNIGGESAVYVNGQEFGCRRNDWVKDQTHYLCDLVLTESAVAGETYEIVLEAYAGNAKPERRGPVMEGEPREQYVDDHPRATVGQNSVVIWNELAYQLYLDIKFLDSARQALPGNSLRKQDIIEALHRFTVEVDFEQDAAGRNADYAKMRRLLEPIMAAHNGSTAPKYFAFGHAHIDVAWLWPLAETDRKVHRTFAGQLALMDQYPDYVFLQSTPYLYRVAKKRYPALYERIKQRVKEGRWIPEGGMWVEADTNVTGGESLIRQFVHGKRFFKEEFGVDNKLLWLPDVFGYTAALPQIMKGCGIDYFSTQKVNWAYNGGDPFPYNDFTWKGLDGTPIRTFIHTNYVSPTTPQEMITRWESQRKQKFGLRGFMIPFGYGDGGGGPTREHIENVHRQKDFEGCPRMEMTNPNRYFAEMPETEDAYVGELYLQVHRGVQTSQAKVKWGNRKCELALRETEALGVLASYAGHPYPLAEMDENWKDVLVCQFHDILPGSSIKRVYDEAYETHLGVLNATAAMREAMAKTLCADENALTVFNSLSFDRTVLVALPEGWDGACADGAILPVQELNGSLVAAVTVPSMGTVVLKPAAAKSADGAVRAALTETGAVIANDRLEAVFNNRGELTSVKLAGREMLNGVSNQMKMFKDTTVLYEAWDIDTSYEKLPVELTDTASFEVVSQGALAAGLKITRRLHNSDMTQLVLLRADSERLDFDTTIEWNEIHKLLKVGFDVNVHADEALHEIQFGYVHRPNHRSRPFDFDRYEVPQHRWTALCENLRGAAVLNDCKYGVNVLGSVINLSLLRAPLAPDPYCDQGTQHFVYSFYPFEGALSESGLMQEAYDLNVPTSQFNGAWQQESALSLLNDETVFVDTMKPAEDGSGDVIVRLYESMGNRTETALTLNLPATRVVECNMLEEDGTPLVGEKNANGWELPLTFRPFEIKTLRISK